MRKHVNLKLEWIKKNIIAIIINAIVNVHNIFFFKKKIVDYIKKAIYP